MKVRNYFSRLFCKITTSLMPVYGLSYTHWSGTSYSVLVAQDLLPPNFISDHPYIDFCPYCVKFIRRDAEGWEVVDQDP